MKKPHLLLALLLVVLVAGLAIVRGVRASGTDDEVREGTGSLKVARGPFVKGLRMTGLVESIRFHNVAAPRLVGATAPGSNTLIITRLMPSGSLVTPGQLLVEFARQNQLKAATDRRADTRSRGADSEKRAEQTGARKTLPSFGCGECRQTARLNIKKNVYLGRIDQEKNEQRLEEAEAKQKQLIATFDLKRKAAQADLRILEIQRDRAYKAMKSAEDNATRMVVTSPISGMVVLRMVGV